MSQGIVPGANAPGQRAEQLQFLRFLAFLNVFIHHADAWNFFGYPASHSGAFAVSFFFMLSGLVTGYGAYGKEIRPTLGNIAGNMWKRIRKVYPLYVLTMLIPVLWSEIPAMVESWDTAGLLQNGKDFLLNLLFLQSWAQGGVRSFNGLGWFLSVLMFLNLTNLPMGWALNRINRSKYRYLLLGGAFCGFWFVTAGYCYVTQGLEMSFWHYSFPPARLGEYLSGMILGYGIRSALHWFSENRVTKLCFTALEIGVLAFWAFSLRRAGNYWMNHIVAWLIPNAMVLTVFTFGKGWISQLFRWRPLAWLGDISFECYLLHQMIILRYMVSNTVAPVPVAGQAFAFFYCLLLTVLLAAMVHKTPLHPGKKEKK